MDRFFGFCRRLFKLRLEPRRDLESARQKSAIEYRLIAASVFPFLFLLKPKLYYTQFF
jgi:hypothetical protein